MIKVSAKAWHAILSRFGSISRGLAHYSISYHTLWQYLPRLGMLFYILSRLGSILQGSACSCSCSMCLGSICLGLACCSISCHALAVSAKAWHTILYLITWQYPPMFGILFYIFSRLDSIRQGLACYSIPYHYLAVSAEAWHATQKFELLLVHGPCTSSAVNTGQEGKTW